MLLEVIGQVLPFAAAVALSPIPIAAVVLILATPRARTNGPLFAVGWVLGLLIVSVVMATLAGGADDSDSGTAAAVDWLRVAVGVLFLVLAVKQWRTRPRDGQEPPMPAWMATIDGVSPGRALVLGAALSGINPKNLALTAAAAGSVAAAGLDGVDTGVAIAVFVALASVTVVGAVLAHLIGGERVAGPLAAVRRFMVVNSNVIMMVILLLLGAKILGDGISGLAS